MKNTFIFVVLLFISSNIMFSQNGHAVYGIKYADYVKMNYNFNKANSDINKMARSLLKGLNKENESIQFDLFFNKKESIFQLQNKLNIDNENSTTIAVSNSKGVFYNNSKERLRQVNSYGSTFIVKYNVINEDNWNLLSENRKIGKYNCFKALNSYNIDGETFEVEAWYTPEIPLKYGPKGFYNLPGLIIELTITNRTKITYFLKTIQIKSSKVKIKKPKKGKKISKKEYDEIGKKLMMKMRNEN